MMKLHPLRYEAQHGRNVACEAIMSAQWKLVGKSLLSMCNSMATDASKHAGTFEK